MVDKGVGVLAASRVDMHTSTWWLKLPASVLGRGWWRNPPGRPQGPILRAALICANGAPPQPLCQPFGISSYRRAGKCSVGAAGAAGEAVLRRLVRRILRKHGYPPDKQEKAARTVLEQAEVLSAGWAA